VHVPGRALAKTVMVKLDGRMAMAVLPSSCTVDFESLRRLTGAKEVKLADEQEFSERFPGCDVGAMPPFGNLYGMPVFVSDELAENDQIVFNAGTHTEVVKLAYRDYDRLVGPKILHFATHAV
jgi:Ala-tRNA(Pro) deacylase